MSVGRAVKRRLVDLGVRVTEVGLSRIGVPPPHALLLLGHMRSGSTLLLHLLANHPQIAAIGERNATYLTPADLARLALRIRLAGRLPLTRLRYVADQVNHNQFTPRPELFAHPRVRLLFLLRRPEASIRSLLELTRTYYQPWSVERAVDYYVERLRTLAGYGVGASGAGPLIQERAALITYEELTERPRETLAGLQGFLRTEPAFSETYQLHDFTGTRGDPGARIRTGRIGRPRAGDDVPLPAQERERARSAYDLCLEALAPLALTALGARASRP